MNIYDSWMESSLWVKVGFNGGVLKKQNKKKTPKNFDVKGVQ